MDIAFKRQIVALLLLAIGLAEPVSAITYTINPNGTATDSNGVIWDRCLYGQTGADCTSGMPIRLTLPQALAAAVEANLANYKGRSDWFLPSRDQYCSTIVINNVDGCVPLQLLGPDPVASVTAYYDNTALLGAASYLAPFLMSSLALYHNAGGNGFSPGNGFWFVNFYSDQGSMHVVNSSSPGGPSMAFRLASGSRPVSVDPFGVLSSQPPVVTAISKNGASIPVTNRSANYAILYYMAVPHASKPPTPGRLLDLTDPTLGPTTPFAGFTIPVPLPSQNSSTIALTQLNAGSRYYVYFEQREGAGPTGYGGTYSQDLMSQFPAPNNVYGPIQFRTLDGLAQPAITFGAQTAAPTFSPGATFSVNPLATAGAGGTGNPVTYSSNTPSVCSVSGTTVSILSGGICTIAADQAGSATYSEATPVTRNVTISRAAQALSFSSTAPANARVGDSYTPTVTSNSGLSPVVLSIASTATNVCSINAGVVKLVALGTCVVNANQAANVSYNAAPQVQQSFAVTVKGNTTTALGSSAGTSTYGQSVTFSATIAGSNPSGTVAFTADGGTTLCGAASISANIATCATSVLQAGSRSIVASFPGDTNNNGSTSSAFTQTVNKRASTTTLSTACMTTFVENQPFTLAATVAGTSPSGSVSFNISGNPLCNGVNVNAGAASCTLPSNLTTPVGFSQFVYNLNASYSGDSNHTASSTAASLPLTVLSAGSVIFRNGLELPPANCPFN